MVVGVELVLVVGGGSFRCLGGRPRLRFTGCWGWACEVVAVSSGLTFFGCTCTSLFSSLLISSAGDDLPEALSEDSSLLSPVLVLRLRLRLGREKNSTDPFAAELDRVMGLRASSEAERLLLKGGKAGLSEPELEWDLVRGPFFCASRGFCICNPSNSFSFSPSSTGILSPALSCKALVGDALEGKPAVVRERFAPVSTAEAPGCSALLLRRVRIIEKYVGFRPEVRKEKVGELGVEVGDCNGEASRR